MLDLCRGKKMVNKNGEKKTGLVLIPILVTSKTQKLIFTTNPAWVLSHRVHRKGILRDSVMLEW